MLKKRTSLALVALGLLATACTLVPVTPGSEKVTLVKPEHIAHCTNLGSTEVGVMDKAGIIARAPESVEEDLVKLAKNSAVGMGGDSIVPASKVVNGKQTYNVYKCRK